MPTFFYGIKMEIRIIFFFLYQKAISQFQKIVCNSDYHHE